MLILKVLNGFDEKYLAKIVQTINVYDKNVTYLLSETYEGTFLYFSFT